MFDAESLPTARMISDPIGHVNQVATDVLHILREPFHACASRNYRSPAGTVVNATPGIRVDWVALAYARPLKLGFVLDVLGEARVSLSGMNACRIHDRLVGRSQECPTVGTDTWLPPIDVEQSAARSPRTRETSNGLHRPYCQRAVFCATGCARLVK